MRGFAQAPNGVRAAMDADEDEDEDDEDDEEGGRLDCHSIAWSLVPHASAKVAVNSQESFPLCDFAPQHFS